METTDTVGESNRIIDILEMMQKQCEGQYDDAGCNEHVAKPIVRLELMHLIDSMLQPKMINHEN